MGNTKTAEEVRKEHTDKMGFELGSLYNSLYNEIIWLHYKWSEFEELYGTKESRIQMNYLAASSGVSRDSFPIRRRAAGNYTQRD